MVPLNPPGGRVRGTSRSRAEIVCFRLINYTISYFYSAFKQRVTGALMFLTSFGMLFFVSKISLTQSDQCYQIHKVSS